MRRTFAGWFLVMPGFTILGMGIGLLIGKPGFGLLSGIGVGMIYWGTILALRGRS